VIRGKVTYKGEVVPFGVVQVYNERGLIAHAPIAPNGFYEARAPAGNVQICVVTDPNASGPTPELGGAGPAGRPPLEGPAGVSGPPRADESPLPPGMGGVPLPMPGMLVPGDDPLKGLTAEQKRMLKEVQKRYSSPLKSRYTLTVQPGEQTHDIRLE
jgi:hypothetical protein